MLCQCLVTPHNYQLESQSLSKPDNEKTTCSHKTITSNMPALPKSTHHITCANGARCSCNARHAVSSPGPPVSGAAHAQVLPTALSFGAPAGLRPPPVGYCCACAYLCISERSWLICAPDSCARAKCDQRQWAHPNLVGTACWSEQEPTPIPKGGPKREHRMRSISQLSGRTASTGAIAGRTALCVPSISQPISPECFFNFVHGDM